MIKIEIAALEDLEKLAEIYCLSYNSINIGEHWTKDTAIKLLESFFIKQPDLFFVAREDSQIIGAIVAFVRPWWDGNHLADGELFVHPAIQKKGVGTKLVKALFTEAKKKYNAKSWDTFTHIVHDHPLSWYKKIGFTQIAHWTMISGDIDTVLKKINALKEF